MQADGKWSATGVPGEGLMDPLFEKTICLTWDSDRAGIDGPMRHLAATERDGHRPAFGGSGRLGEFDLINRRQGFCTTLAALLV